MKYYKLLNRRNGYPHHSISDLEIFSEDHIITGTCNVAFFVSRFPNDWKEVTGEEMKNENWKSWMKREKIKSIYEKWDFKQFGIICKFCNSQDVEINGEGELGSGYYDEPEHDGTILVKCHGCGKAMKIELNGSWDLKGENKEINDLVTAKKLKSCIDEWISYDGGKCPNAIRNIKEHKKQAKELLEKVKIIWFQTRTKEDEETIKLCEEILK